MITCGLELVVDSVKHHMLYSGVELITKAKTQTDQLLIIMMLIMAWPLHWVAVLEGYVWFILSCRLSSHREIRTPKI